MLYPYFMPTKFFFGKNALIENGHLMKNIGTKAMLVTGKKSAILSGAQKDVLLQLKKNNQTYILFNEISENPTVTSIFKAAEIFKKENCDFLIGIGGGSPIDAAKAISVIVANNLDKNEIYDSTKMEKAFPIISIPTTSGTGTEVTPYSVITDLEKSKKAGFGSPNVFPMMSYLDPEYTISLPSKITRDTAIDALSHLLEGFYSKKRNVVLNPIILEGIRLIYTSLKPCLAEPKNLTHRKSLMLASLYGGIVIAQTSTTLQHSIGYPLTTVYGLSHGFANGVVMKEMMNRFEQYIPVELTLLWSYLNITKADFFEWLDDLNLTINFEVEKNFIQQRVSEVMASRNMALNPYDVKADEVEAIYMSLNRSK